MRSHDLPNGKTILCSIVRIIFKSRLPVLDPFEWCLIYLGFEKFQSGIWENDLNSMLGYKYVDITLYL